VQHWREVYSQQSQNPKSFAGVDLDAVLFCPGLIEHSWEAVTMTQKHEGNNVRSFIPRFHARLVGIEATGSIQWFVNLMEELGIECQVGHPANIRAAELRKQRHDRRDADLILLARNVILQLRSP
jgi:transposase